MTHNPYQSPIANDSRRYDAPPSVVFLFNMGIAIGIVIGIGCTFLVVILCGLGKWLAQ